MFRLAAFILFLAAAFGSFGWLVAWEPSTIVGLLALGLAAYVASSITVPALDPPRGSGG